MMRDHACGEVSTTENDTTHAKASIGHFERTCDGGADLGKRRAHGTECERVRRHRHDPGRAIAALSPIEAWRQLHFGSPENTGQGADLNIVANDGMTNLMKYALGINPTTPGASAAPTGTRQGGLLKLTFTRRRDATDITYRVEGTSDPTTDWTTLYSSAQTPYEGGQNESSPVTVSDNPPSGTPTKRFMRLKVTRP